MFAIDTKELLKTGYNNGEVDADIIKVGSCQLEVLSTVPVDHSKFITPAGATQNPSKAPSASKFKKPTKSPGATNKPLISAKPTLAVNDTNPNSSIITSSVMPSYEVPVDPVPPHVRPPTVSPRATTTPTTMNEAIENDMMQHISNNQYNAVCMTECLDYPGNSPFIMTKTLFLIQFYYIHFR